MTLRSGSLIATVYSVGEAASTLQSKDKGCSITTLPLTCSGIPGTSNDLAFEMKFVHGRSDHSSLSGWSCRIAQDSLA